MTDGLSIAKDLADGSFDRALEAAIEFGMVEGEKAGTIAHCVDRAMPRSPKLPWHCVDTGA
jgi:hypothetical protein